MAEPGNASLLLLARGTRARTLALLDAAADDELTWAPPGTSNHVLWHAGHAAWLQETLCLRLLSGRPSLPAGWERFFGMGSHPATPPGPWPPRGVVRTVLAGQLPRLVAALGPLTTEQLDARPPFAAAHHTRTLRQCVVHGLHDEANHQGEMYLLLKIRRRARNYPPYP
jgi:hypothetical protein